jgi:hypothetical protein
MPAWALPGPEFLESDGSLSGHITGWPAIELVETSLYRGAKRILRPSPHHLRQIFDSSKSIFGERAALLKYREGLRALATRRKARDAEKNRSGLTAAEAALDALYDRLEAVNIEIEALSPSTPNAAAARIVVEVLLGADPDVLASDSGGPAVAAIGLAHLRPALRGIIPAHVDELLANPDMRLGSALAYVGDSGEGADATEMVNAA